MLKNILLILFLLFLLFFGFSNSNIVTLDLVPGFLTIETKLYLVIFVSFLLGFVFCYFAYSFKFLTIKFANFKQRRQIRKLEREVNSKEIVKG